MECALPPTVRVLFVGIKDPPTIHCSVLSQARPTLPKKNRSRTNHCCYGTLTLLHGLPFRLAHRFVVPPISRRLPSAIMHLLQTMPPVQVRMPSPPPPLKNRALLSMLQELRMSRRASRVHQVWQMRPLFLEQQVAMFHVPQPECCASLH